MFGLQQLHGLSSNNNSNIIHNIGHHLINGNGNGGKLSLVERIKENVESVLNSGTRDSSGSTMKWSSSSSSSLSSASDRRSVFYAEPMLVLQDKVSALEASNLRVTLQNTEENLEMQVKKCENLISFFTNQIKSLTAELKNEKMWRAQQLTKIVKALLCFEAKLKNDQKLIRRQLYEKDSEINRLSQEIYVLRERYGDSTEVNVNDVAQYCPTCRKQYYRIDSKNVSVQVHNHRKNTDTSPTQSLDVLSSSEEGIPSFAEARRSKKYMSKRTSGTFRDYLRSRSNESKECGFATNFNQNNNKNNNNNSTMTTHRNDNNDNNNDSNDVDDDGYNDDDDKENGTCERGNNRKTKTNRGRNYGKRSVDSNGMTTYSSLINNLHGLKMNVNLELETADNDDTKSSYDEDDDSVFHSSGISFLKKCNAEEMEKQQFESNDDWYASASDMDDSDSALSKTYGHNTVNPVLECVNQILLQQSIDGIIASSPSPEVTESTHKEPNSRQKRVHFSTQNSMVHVPRVDNSFQTLLTPDDPMSKEQPFNYESVYTNEYEPIGSENNSSSHYVDMEAKIGPDDRSIIAAARTKIPPALPPKPANLMKIRQALKISATKFPHTIPIAATPSANKSITCENMETISEPDYCSISEVNDTIQKIQIVADVHKNADEMSTASDDAKTDATDETFADIPKLPNVAAIISPKKDVASTKFIAQDNYITKSAPVKLIEEKDVSEILAEIKSKKTSLPPPSLKQTKIQSPPIIMNGPRMEPCCPPKTIDDKISIHAEFDWYNLDVEYGKLNPPDVIRETHINQTNHVEELNEEEEDDDDDDEEEENIGIEYNLEKEFVLNSSPDIIRKISHEIDESLTLSKKTTVDFDRVNLDTPSKKTFESFLADTGLLTKPLPRKRKIYYSAPFV